ncbi:MAG: sulfite exporter TauE/SafE family protein [Gemmatimonadaceae bacterium]
MCGGFVCLYAGAGAKSSVHGFGAHLAYNGGRLVSYLTLGLVAGSLGARLNDFGRLASIQRSATIVAGSLMVIWASAMLATSFGLRLPRFGAPTWVRQQFGGALLALREQPAAVRAGAMGLLTTLLPCGWLYTFVVTAGGTGSAISGATVMLAFWAGTIPMLLSVGLGVQQIARPIARHLPVASAILVFALGALSIAGKLRPIGNHGMMSHSAPAAHVVP